MKKTIRSAIAGVAALVAVAAMTLQSEPARAETPAEPVILTLFGPAVSKSNRGPLDPFHDAFFKFQDRSFKKAYSFTRADLLKLPQQRANARVEGWPKAVIGEGPLLTDVLKAAGVKPGAAVTLYALDGYGGELAPLDLTTWKWVLALKANGKPLGLGGRGPAWLMYDTGGKPIKKDLEASWVWSVTTIKAE